MRTHLGDAEVQIAGAHALEKLCDGNGARERELCAAVAATAVAAMRAHPADGGVQSAAIYALTSTSFYFSAELSESGAVEAVVSALRTHAVHPIVPSLPGVQCAAQPVHLPG
jgi:hypothetical protein